MAAPAYAATDIAARVRTLLKEPSARLYSVAEITAWTDEAARQVSVLTLCNEDADLDVSLVATLPYASLTKDFIEIESVVLLPTGANSATDKGLQRITPLNVGHGEVGLSSASAVPKFWFYVQDSTNKLYVWPAALTGTDDTVDVYGYTMVDAYGGAGSETLPDELQHLCIDYVMCKAMIKARKHATAAGHLKRFIDGCASVRNDVADRLMLVDTADMLRIPDRTVYVQ